MWVPRATIPCFTPRIVGTAHRDVMRPPSMMIPVPVKRSGRVRTESPTSSTRRMSTLMSLPRITRPTESPAGIWYVPGSIRVEAVITIPGVYGTLRCWAVVSAGRRRRAARS